MATTKVNKCKLVLKYDKEGSSSYSINSSLDAQTLFDTATAINSLQFTPFKGIFKSTEEQIENE